jgi:hypothetical protein
MRLARVACFVCLSAALSACTGDPGNGLERTQGALINGSLDLSFVQHEAAAAVGIIATGGTFCSGNLVRNNVVLTSRHCVTSDGTLNGPVTSNPSALRARWQNIPNNQCYVYASGTCQNVAQIIAAPFDPNSATNVDAALLVLAGPITVNGDSQTFFSPIDPFATSFHQDEWAVIVALGTDENGARGILKQGDQLITATELLTTSPGSRFRFLRAGETFTPGTAAAPGDSGGGLWMQNLAQHTIVGLESNGGGAAFVESNFARAEDFRYQFNKYISDNFTSAASYVSLPAAGLAAFDQIAGSSNTHANWQTVGSTIVQKANTAKALLLLKGGIYENVSLGVDLSSSDDDDIGLVARYVDQDNYLYCAVNRAKRYLRIVERAYGAETAIATRRWTGSTSTRKNMSLYVSESFVDCNFASEVDVSGYQYDLVVGRAGMYNDFNSGGTFYSFSATPGAVINSTW